MPANRNAYFTAPRTRSVTVGLRPAIWKELSDAYERMAADRQKELTIDKLCVEIIEAWAAERRMIRAEQRQF